MAECHARLSKSGLATFFEKEPLVLRLCCPLIADNSTLTPRKVFSATHMSRQKTNYAAFASADAKLCEAFFDILRAWQSAMPLVMQIRVRFTCR